MSENEVLSPKVFISYSWSSDAHQKSVIQLAERLISDGVDVVLDIWDLKTGNNLHKFMESMVVSSSITKVLLILDKYYKEKSNNGTGGVGIESEIVSGQIYNNANQDKFIPIVWEKDENNIPYLPVFLSSRFYIDLSQGNQKDEYQDLLRIIFNKPRHVKPSLGKAPAYLFAEGSKSLPSSFYDITKVLNTGELASKRFLLKTFFDDLYDSVQSLKIIEIQSATDELVLEKIQSFLPTLIEYDKILSNLIILEPKGILKYLRDFFESCLDSYSSDDQSKPQHPNQFAAIKFVSQELLIHTVAVFLKSEYFSELNELLSSGLIKRKWNSKESGNIMQLYEPIEILDITRNRRLNLNRTSITADLIKERTTTGELTFDDITQADIILYLRALFTQKHWFPRTLIYHNEWVTFDVFLRSEVTNYFYKFAPVIAIKDRSDLENKCKDKGLRLQFHMYSLSTICNLSKIATI
jgi:hypothetical protein